MSGERAREERSFAGPTPAVSVLIPAYNAGATIAPTLRSVLGQSFSDLEVIVVDDGSSDDTLARIRSVADPRLAVIAGDHGGVSRARNRALAAARGRYVTFLDADDLWTRDKLAAQIAALEADPGAAAVYSWTAFIDEAGRFLFAKPPQHLTGDVHDELLTTFFLASGSNVLARRSCIEAVGLFDPDAEPVEDWEYWLRAARRHRFAVAPGYHVLYRFTRGSASAAAGRYLQKIRQVAERAVAAGEAPAERLPECLANARLHACVLLLARSQDPGSHAAAGRVMLALVKERPRVLAQPRALMMFAAWTALLPAPAARRCDLMRRLLGWAGGRGPGAAAAHALNPAAPSSA